MNFEYELFAYAGFGNNNNVGRFYINYASLSLAQTNDVTSTLDNCVIGSDFYGGGNLGKVGGNVSSTLNSCKVNGSVFGAGFSAQAPTCDVYPLDTRYKTGIPTSANTYGPYWEGNAGVYYEGQLDKDPVTYTWHQVGSVSKDNEFDETNHYIYTTEDMTTLGKVMGNVQLTLKGDTEVAGDVFGGGNEGHVEGSTTVNILE